MARQGLGRYLGWAVVATGLVLAMPEGPFQRFAILLVSACAAAVAAGGVVRLAPAPALPWWCVCAILAVNALSDACAAFASLESLPAGLRDALVTGRAGTDLATAAVGVVAAVAFVLARHPDRQLDGVLDAGIAVLGVLLLTAASPLGRLLDTDPVTVAAVAATAVALVVVGGMVGLERGGRPLSLYLLLAAGGLTLAGNLLRFAVGVRPWLGAAGLLAPLIGAAAALHPSMVRLVAPVPAVERRVGPLRLVVLGVALLVNPAIVLAQALGSGDRTVFAGGVGLLTLLVLARLGGLLGERERIRAAYLDSEQRLRALVQHAFDVLAVVDRDGVVAYLSPSAGQALGRAPSACLGVHLRELVTAADAAVVQAALDAVRTHPSGVTRIEVRLDQADGDVRWGDVLLANRLADPSVRGIVVNLRDVTDRKRAELELSRLALHDPLTGLPNRVQLLERVAGALQGPDACALLFCDLDGFKAVNDRHGHDVGDRLLIAVADRLREALRGEDQPMRFGGDEFVVLCVGIASEAQVLTIAARLRSRLCEPFAMRGVELRIGCSIGIATADRAGRAPEDLLDAADRAMYRAKRTRSGIAVHDWAATPAPHLVDLTAHGAVDSTRSA